MTLLRGWANLRHHVSVVTAPFQLSCPLIKYRNETILIGESQRTWRETCLIVTLLMKYSTWTGLALNLDLHDDM
jgi:hypothetical protein